MPRAVAVMLAPSHSPGPSPPRLHRVSASPSTTLNPQPRQLPSDETGAKIQILAQGPPRTLCALHPAVDDLSFHHSPRGRSPEREGKKQRGRVGVEGGESEGGKELALLSSVNLSEE